MGPDNELKIGRENLPLFGKVFLLTGASRGIGAATAIELAKRGADVVSQVGEIGGRMVAPVADVTKPEHRVRLLDQIKEDFDQIDGIIFNHKVNGTSKQELFQEAELKRVLADSVVVIDVPSLWSTFQHTGIEQLPQGEKLLKQSTRDYNKSNRQYGKTVKFGSVCGHAIGDMAQAIADMAAGVFEDEEIVFVGIPQIRRNEMPDALPMYNNQTRYVDSLVRFDDRRAFGYYIVRENDTRSHFSSQDGALDHVGFGIGKAVLDVTDNHTLGHFTPGFKISILPVPKIVAATAKTVSFEAPYMVFPRLAGIEGIDFKVPVLPGDRLSIEATNPDEMMEQGTNVSVILGNTEVASVRGLKFERKTPETKDGMSLDRLIEAAAQTLGLAYLHSRDIRDVLPLFGGVRGPIEYLREVYPGQLLEMEAVLSEGSTAKQFSGDVTFRVDDEVVARVSGIDCRLFPSRGLERVIRMSRMKLE